MLTFHSFFRGQDLITVLNLKNLILIKLNTLSVTLLARTKVAEFGHVSAKEYLFRAREQAQAYLYYIFFKSVLYLFCFS